MEAIKILLNFVLKLQKGISISLEDGKFDISDINNFKDAFLQVPYVSVALPYIKGSFKDITMEELSELKLHFAKEFDLKDDKIENIIEESLSIGLALFSLVVKIKS